MILYEQDWKRYPTAIVHETTRNESWLRQAGKYKAMGVSNYCFHLALLQPALADFDPHDPNLPDEIILMMLLEMEENPWYFLREVFRVPAGSGSEARKLDANRGNIAMFWCVFNAFITYVQQIRQTGKSLNTRALVALFHHVLARNSQHILFTKGDLRKDEIKNYKLIREALPKWMWYLTAKDRDNQHEYTTLSRGNFTKTYIPQGDEEAANNVGRGTTPTFVTVDEPPFLAYARKSIAALIAATTQSFDIARANGSFHGILYTTTAGDLSTDSGKFVYEKIKKRGMYFSEMLFDARDREDAVDLICANSRDDGSRTPYIDISFSHLQLGYTDQWLRGKIGTTPASIDAIKRDYLGQWTYGSASNPIKERTLNRIRAGVNEDFEPVKTKDNYIIRYHVPKEEIKRRYTIIGLDTSNAVGRDAITGVMTDVETGEVVMSYQVNEGYLNKFAYWLVEAFVEFPLMTMIPEAKSSWDGIRDILIIELCLRGIDPGRRIYSRIVDNSNGSESERKLYREFTAGVPTERKYYPHRSQFGFPTSGTLREVLYKDILSEATAAAPELIRDPVLIDELSSLVERNNRIDHKASGHDDHVISWLMAQWFLRKARNLEHYGIPRGIVLSKLKLATAGRSPSETRKVTRNEKLLAEIKGMEERLEKSKNPMEIQYLENRINSLRTEVRQEDSSEFGSIDRISAEAKEKKSAQQRSSTSPDGIFSRNRLWR